MEDDHSSLTTNTLTIDMDFYRDIMHRRVAFCKYVTLAVYMQTRAQVVPKTSIAADRFALVSRPVGVFLSHRRQLQQCRIKTRIWKKHFAYFHGILD